MTPLLLKYLCEPITKYALQLKNAEYDAVGNIKTGELIAPSGKTYKITDGIPRFVDSVPIETVESFGSEWNHFNFTEFKVNWLSHTVTNTFGTTDVFNNKLIVDAGGGSGAQTKWFVEYGAKHVILMELSPSIDNVIKANLAGIDNVDLIQCSIDAPPLKDQSIDGIVYCHNVIQHTPSVEKTAHALYAIVAPGGEFVFNCYRLNDEGIIRWVRFHLINQPLRALLSRMPFRIILIYSRLMAAFRLIPGLGSILEKVGFCVQGDVPYIDDESVRQRLIRQFRTTTLNTFDAFGAHKYQHYKSETEIRNLLNEIQPDTKKVLNYKKYFHRPVAIGCALRVFR